MIDQDLITKWHIGNDLGNGYAIGDEDMTPAEAAESDGLYIIDEDAQGNVVARPQEWGNEFVVIRDHNGPWAVTVSVG